MSISVWGINAGALYRGCGMAVSIAFSYSSQLALLSDCYFLSTILSDISCVIDLTTKFKPLYH